MGGDIAKSGSKVKNARYKTLPTDSGHGGSNSALEERKSPSRVRSAIRHQSDDSDRPTQRRLQINSARQPAPSAFLEVDGVPDFTRDISQSQQSSGLDWLVLDNMHLFTQITCIPST